MKTLLAIPVKKPKNPGFKKPKHHGRNLDGFLVDVLVRFIAFDGVPKFVHLFLKECKSLMGTVERWEGFHGSFKFIGDVN